MKKIILSRDWYRGKFKGDNTFYLDKWKIEEDGSLFFNKAPNKWQREQGDKLRKKIDNLLLMNGISSGKIKNRIVAIVDVTYSELEIAQQILSELDEIVEGGIPVEWAFNFLKQFDFGVKFELE